MDTKYANFSGPKDVSEQFKELKQCLRSLLSTAVDVDFTGKEIMEMVAGIAAKEKKVREEKLKSILGKEVAEDFSVVHSIDKVTLKDGQYYEIERSVLFGRGLYQKMINASAASRLLPISGKVLTEDRLLNIIESKLFWMVETKQPQLEAGKLEENAAFDRVRSLFSEKIRKSYCWVNSRLPIFVSSPDALLLNDDNSIRAPIEIKTLTSDNRTDILRDLKLLNKASDLGIRVTGKEATTVEIRRASATYTQIQLQIWTMGVAYGYLTIFKAATGAVFSKKVWRDNEYLQSIIERAEKHLPRIVSLAATNMPVKPVVSCNDTKVDASDQLALGDWLTCLNKRSPEKGRRHQFNESLQSPSNQHDH